MEPGQLDAQAGGPAEVRSGLYLELNEDQEPTMRTVGTGRMGAPSSGSPVVRATSVRASTGGGVTVMPASCFKPRTSCRSGSGSDSAIRNPSSSASTSLVRGTRGGLGSSSVITRGWMARAAHGANGGASASSVTSSSTSSMMSSSKSSVTSSSESSVTSSSESSAAAASTCSTAAASTCSTAAASTCSTAAASTCSAAAASTCSAAAASTCSAAAASTCSTAAASTCSTA